MPTDTVDVLLTDLNLRLNRPTAGTHREDGTDES